MSDESGSSRGRDESTYRWICPICRATNIGVAGRKNAPQSAVDALRSHIRTSDGDGHGRKYELPGDIERESLFAYVEIFD
jgi:hypothetical protein